MLSYPTCAVRSLENTEQHLQKLKCTRELPRTRIFKLVSCALLFPFLPSISVVLHAALCLRHWDRSPALGPRTNFKLRRTRETGRESRVDEGPVQLRSWKVGTEGGTGRVAEPAAQHLTRGVRSQKQDWLRHGSEPEGQVYRGRG